MKRPLICFAILLMLAASIQAQSAIQKGVVIFDRVPIMRTPSFSSDTLLLLNAFSTLTILERGVKTEVFDAPENDICSYHPWVRVRHKEKTGSIYGRWIFSILNDESRTEPINKTVIPLDGKKYRFCLLQNFSVGPADSNGLTGCDDIYILCLHTEDYSSFILFESDGQQPSHETYCCLGSSDGFSESITGIEVKGEVITLRFNVGYQEDVAEYDLVLSREGEKWKGVVRNFIRTTPGNE